MVRYVVYRLLWLVPTLLAMALVTFLVMHATPGSPLDPVAEGANPLSPEAQKNLAELYGLDKPLYVQFGIFLKKALHGDFGTSFVTKRPVTGELLDRFTVTVELTVIAALIALAIGATTGLVSARLRGRADWIVRIWNGLILAVPNFVVATLIVLLAGLYAPQIAVFGYTPFFTDPVANLASLILPALSLALAVSVTISENTRAAVLEVVVEGASRELAEGHDAFLSPLPDHAQQRRPPVDARERQADELRDAQARAVQELDHRDVAPGGGRLAARRAEQRLDFFGEQGSR